MQRSSTVASGGLLDLNNDIIFPFGTVFLKSTEKQTAGSTTAAESPHDPSLDDIIAEHGHDHVTPGAPIDHPSTTYEPDTLTATFDDIIDYLTIYRIQNAMGTVGNPGPSSNAVKNALPISRQKPMGEIFLNSMPVVDAVNTTAAGAAGGTLGAAFFANKLKQKSGIVMTKSWFRAVMTAALP